MSCCTDAGYRSIFGTKLAERDAHRYRRRGLRGSAAWLRDALVREGIAERSVLEIGGGIGGMQIDLLKAGAGRAANVEIIDSYEPAARELIAEHGFEQRIARRIGDLVQDRDLAPAADIVVLHRVICCYPDADGLMRAACEHARERVAITIPRHAWWVRLTFAGMNAWLRVRRVAFRAYVHPPGPMLDAARARGFHPIQHVSGPIWESVILGPPQRPLTDRG